MWNELVLTESEDRVLTALRFLEPKIDRISATTDVRDVCPYSSRVGFKVKLKDSAEPIPIGSLGDGNWRMLAMAMALIKSKDSILLVDEIDTGLHFSVLGDLWKLISQTAQEFNVQVFATTHSFDCVKSLAAICGGTDDHNVSIQRIEIGKTTAVPFNEAEINAAAKADIELR